MAQFNPPDNGWINRVWQTEDCRRWSIDVVDARDPKRFMDDARVHPSQLR